MHICLNFFLLNLLKTDMFQEKNHTYRFLGGILYIFRTARPLRHLINPMKKGLFILLERTSIGKWIWKLYKLCEEEAASFPIIYFSTFQTFLELNIFLFSTCPIYKSYNMWFLPKLQNNVMILNASVSAYRF